MVLSEILEEFPNTPSYPDALWLRGETYYAQRDYLAARRDYRELVDHGSEPRFETYFGKALARLVDVSLRLNDPPETLAPIFEKFNQVPPAQVDAALLYAKGKALLPPGLVERRDGRVLAGRATRPITPTRRATSRASSR